MYSQLKIGNQNDIDVIGRIFKTKLCSAIALCRKAYQSNVFIFSNHLQQVSPTTDIGNSFLYSNTTELTYRKTTKSLRNILSNHSRKTIPPLAKKTSEITPLHHPLPPGLDHDLNPASCVYQGGSLSKAVPTIKSNSDEWLVLNLRENPLPKQVKHSDIQDDHTKQSIVSSSASIKSKNEVSINAPIGHFAKAIETCFGSYKKFQIKFEEEGKTLLGKGCIWLVYDRNRNGSLLLFTTRGHKNHVQNRYVPLLVVDVWKHAYYLNNLDSRDKYLKAWWAVVNWDKVEIRYDMLYKKKDIFE